MSSRSQVSRSHSASRRFAGTSNRNGSRFGDITVCDDSEPPNASTAARRPFELFGVTLCSLTIRLGPYAVAARSCASSHAMTAARRHTRRRPILNDGGKPAGRASGRISQYLNVLSGRPVMSDRSVEFTKSDAIGFSLFEHCCDSRMTQLLLGGVAIVNPKRLCFCYGKTGPLRYPVWKAGQGRA